MLTRGGLCPPTRAKLTHGNVRRSARDWDTGHGTPPRAGPRQSRESIGLTWGFGVADTR